MPITITAAGPVTVVPGETYIIAPGVTGTVTFVSTETPPPAITVQINETPTGAQLIDIQSGIASTVAIADGVNAASTDVVSSTGGATEISVGDGARLGNVTGSSAADSVSVGTGGSIGTVSTGDGADSITLGSGVSSGSITTGGGDDSLSVGGGSTTGAISTGTGDDSVTTAAGSTTGTISTGDGADIVRLSGTASSVDTGAGADSVVVGDGARVTGAITTGTDAQADIDRVTTGAGSSVGSVTTGGGADVVSIGGTSTTITSGAGDDSVTIRAGGSASAINSGVGDDTVSVAGSAGTITTTDGADTVSVTGTATTVSTGGGDDLVRVSGRVGSISSGDGSDTVRLLDGATVTGSIQTYTSLAEANADYVLGGNNLTLGGSVLTGGGNDVVSLGTGLRMTTSGTALIGGTGDDYISVGLGANFGSSGTKIQGGDGNDTLAVVFSGTGRTWVTDGGAGYDTGFNVGNSAYTTASLTNSNWNRISGTNNWVPSAYGTGTDRIPTQTSDSSTSTYWWQGLNYFRQNQPPPPPPPGTPPVCFVAGTLIETARGPVAIETLAEGDLVVTRDHGLQPLRWIGRRRLGPAELGAQANLRPIRIRAGALGAGLPTADLLVSPQHRVLVRSHIAQRMFGAPEVLVAARQLLAIDGIEVADDLPEVTYLHLLFDRHEVVISNGAETESLYTGPEALKSLGAAAAEEVFAIFPELRDGGHTPEAARPLVPGRQARRLAERHAQNGKPLLA